MTKKTFGIRSALAIAGIAAASMLLAPIAQAAGSGDGEDRRVRIINETRHTMVHFYASNISVIDWQEDILGRSVLRAGSDVVINIDDGTGHCEYDFKAVFDDGDSVVKHDINVCKVSFYRYTE